MFSKVKSWICFHLNKHLVLFSNNRLGKQFRFQNFAQFIYDTVSVVSLTISRLKTNRVSQNGLSCVKRDNLARQHCSKNITKFAKKRPWENILAKSQSPVGKQSFVHFSQSVRVCIANQDKVCTILVVTWTCQSGYMDLSKLLHIFVKVITCVCQVLACISCPLPNQRFRGMLNLLILILN